MVKPQSRMQTSNIFNVTSDKLGDKSNVEKEDANMFSNLSHNSLEGKLFQVLDRGQVDRATGRWFEESDEKKPSVPERHPAAATAAVQRDNRPLDVSVANRSFMSNMSVSVHGK